MECVVIVFTFCCNCLEYRIKWLKIGVDHSWKLSDIFPQLKTLALTNICSLFSHGLTSLRVERFICILTFKMRVKMEKYWKITQCRSTGDNFGSAFNNSHLKFRTLWTGQTFTVRLLFIVNSVWTSNHFTNTSSDPLAYPRRRVLGLYSALGSAQPVE